MLRKLVRALALIPLFWVVQAQALGLGEIDVHSRLNQRFTATIPVVGASAEDLENLTVRLASAADFERSGVEQTGYLTSLGFSVDGSRVTVASKQIAREPLLNFVVEARWRGGRLLREYTVFLDPPADDQQASAAPAAAAASAAPRTERAPAPANAPATRAAAPARVASEADGTADVGSSSYGPTAPQETLWSIATKVRPGPGVTMDQVLLALYQANPGAFVGGLGGLQKGATLTVPSASAMEATDADTAHAQVARLRSGRALAPASAAALAEPRPAAVPRTPAAAPAVAAKAAVAPAAPKSPLTGASSPTASSPPSDLAPFGTAGSPAKAPPSTPAAAPSATGAFAAASAGASSPAASGSPGTATTAAVGTPAPSSTPAPAPASPPASTGTTALSATTAPSAAAASPTGSGPTTAAPAATPPATTPATTPSAASPAPATPAVATPAPSPAATPPTPAAAESHGLLEGWLIPLILVLILLLLVGMVLWRRRDKPAQDLPPVKLTPKTNLVKPVLAGAAAGGAAAAASAAPASRTTPSLLDEPLLRSTALDPPAQTQAPAPSLPSTGGDFDRVAPSETRPVNVAGDSNDPLSEADFHLAYGLYDEAAALLKQAIARDPERSALRMKLAETYFAAGRPLEFQEVAEEIHSKLGPAEWNKVAGMGRQLSPGAALFAQGATAAAGAPTPAPVHDLDFAFDLPSPTLKTAPSPGAVPQDHFVLPDVEAPPAAPPAAAASSSRIDFDLEQELLKDTAPAAPATPKPDLDLTDFDLDAQSPKRLADVGTVEFNLDELDLSDSGGGDALSGAGDEMGTKLDLARAYSDMGDNEAARGLLGEVVKGGSAAQKQEAEALLQRLSA